MAQVGASVVEGGIVSGSSSSASLAAAPPITVFRHSDFADLSRAPDLRDPDTGGDLYLAWKVGMRPDGGTLCVQMKAGKACGAHSHADMTHYVNVVRGTVHVILADSVTKFGPGDCYVLPAGLVHDVAAGPEGDAWFVETTLRDADPEKAAG